MTRYQEEVVGMRPLRKRILRSNCQAYLQNMVKESELAILVATWVATAANQRLGELRATTGKPMGTAARFSQERCDCA